MVYTRHLMSNIPFSQGMLVCTQHLMISIPFGQAGVGTERLFQLLPTPFLQAADFGL